MSSKLNPVAQLILLAVTAIWGWTFVIVKEALADMGVFTFLFYRFSIAFLILFFIFWPRLRTAERRLWIKGAIIGITLFLGYWAQTAGLDYTTATKSAFITSLSVVLVPIFGVFLFRDRVPNWAWIGAFVSAIGLGLILFGNVAEQLDINLGDILTLGCAIAFAFQILLISHFTRAINYIPILVAQIGTVALLSGIGMTITEGVTLPRTALSWEAILITGVLATAFAFWAQTRYQPESSATRTAIIFATEPVFAAAFGFLLLNERLAELQLIGAALIVVAVFVSQIQPKHKQRV
jgi:drug/metabolite transporter (DMT)-like permease